MDGMRRRRRGRCWVECAGRLLRFLFLVYPYILVFRRTDLFSIVIAELLSSFSR